MRFSIRNPLFHPPRYPLLSVILAVLILAAGCGDPLENEAKKPYNVLLISVDTLRADHVGAYGYKTIETPNMDRLIEQGVMFEHAFTPVPITLPAHTSLMTGTYPTYHQVRNNGIFHARESLTTLAETLKGAGYDTAAVIGALVLDAEYGLDQGFDLYDDDIHSGGDGFSRFWEISDRSARQVTREALAYLDRPRGGPFFLWLHYFDPHGPYTPPKPFAERYENPYDGEIAYVDEQLGVLLDAMRRGGIEEDTIVILTADHGEGLGEHDESTHGFLLYDATLHVPLTFYNPELFGTAREIAAPVSLVDVMPTVLDLLRIDPPGGGGAMQGKSLKPLMAGKADRAHDRLYFETLMPYFDFGWAGLRGLRTEKYKYISAPMPELYRVGEDPREETNVYEREKAAGEALDKALGEWVAEHTFTGEEARGKALSAEDQAQLSALGYSSGAKHARIEGDPFEGADPKSMMWMKEEINRSNALFYEGDYAGALRLCQSLLERDPNNGNILLHLASFNTDMGRFEEAGAYIDQLIEVTPDSEKAWTFRGVVYEKQGRYAEAIEAFRKTLDMNPENIEALYNLSTLYGKQGRYAEAEEGLRKIIALDPPSTPKAYVCLGVIYASQGDFEKAASFYLKALELDPKDGDALLGSAQCYLRLDDIKSALQQINRAQRLGVEVPQELLQAVNRTSR